MFFWKKKVLIFKTEKTVKATKGSEEWQELAMCVTEYLKRWSFPHDFMDTLFE